MEILRIAVVEMRTPNIIRCQRGENTTLPIHKEEKCFGLDGVGEIMWMGLAEDKN